MTVKAVLFDLGNTLIYSNPVETFQKILEAHGIFRSIDSVEQALIKGNREFDVEKHSNLTAHEFYTKWNLIALKHLGITDEVKARKLAEEINFQWFKFARIHIYSDVKKTLQRLKKMGLKLGLITGGYEEEIEKILLRTGLENFFDVSVGADTTGKRKPHPEAFEYAVRQLDIKSHEAIFVGDSFDRDYSGAKKAGLIPVLIRREGNKLEASSIRCITSLDEIFKVLENIEVKSEIS